MENKGSVVGTHAVVLKPATAKDWILLANLTQVSDIPVKTEDGGLPQTDNSTGQDAFMLYSNDIVRRAAILNQAAVTEEEEEDRGDDNPGANQLVVRRTRLTFKVHPDLFFQYVM